MPVEIPTAIQPPPTGPETVSERQKQLDAILNSGSIQGSMQKQVRDAFAQPDLAPEQLKQKLDTLPVDDGIKHNLWNTYYIYEPPKAAAPAPELPKPPGILTRVGNAIVDAIPTDKIKKMPTLSPPPAPSKLAGQSFDTKLTPTEESQFQTWKSKYAPKDSGEDYDLRGAFKAGLTPDPTTGHWPDTFKKPNHPTFSNESQYAAMAPDKAGHWDANDNYVPPGAPTPKSAEKPQQAPSMLRERQPSMELGNQPPSPLPPPPVPFGTKELPVPPRQLPPQKQTTWMDTLAGLPGGFAAVRAENAKKSTWEAFRDTMATMTKMGGGLLQGVSLGHYDPEKGTIELPESKLGKESAYETGGLYFGGDSKKKITIPIHHSLSDILQNFWGVPADIAKDPTPAPIGDFVGTAYTWGKASKVISGASAATEAMTVSKLTAEGIPKATIEQARPIVQSILKNAGIQAATGEAIAHLEKPPDNETPADREIRAGKTAIFGASLSALLDSVAHLLAGLPKAPEGTLTGEAQRTVDDVINDVYDAFYKSGSFSSEEAARTAANRAFNSAMEKSGMKAVTPEEFLDSVNRRFEANKATGETAPPETTVPPVPEAVQPPEVKAAPAVEAKTPKATEKPEIPEVPKPTASAPIPPPAAKVEKPETPPKPVTPEELGIAPPRKQFTHAGQYVVGTSEGKIVLADGSLVERAPSYIKTLGSYGYKELTPEQIGGLAGLAAANKGKPAQEAPVAPIAETPPPLEEQTPAFSSIGPGPTLTDTRGGPKPEIERPPSGVPQVPETPVTLPEVPGTYTVRGGEVSTIPSGQPTKGESWSQEFTPDWYAASLAGPKTALNPPAAVIPTFEETRAIYSKMLDMFPNERQTVPDMLDDIIRRRMQNRPYPSVIRAVTEALGMPQPGEETKLPAVPEPETSLKPKGTQELIKAEPIDKGLYGPRWTVDRGLNQETEAWLDGNDAETANAGLGKNDDGTFSVETKDGDVLGPFETEQQAVAATEKAYPQANVTPRNKGYSSLDLPVVPSHPLPEHPPGPRWNNDPGAMPGEPAFFLDGKTADDPNTKAAIVENEIPEKGGVNWSAHLENGRVIGPYASAAEAAAEAEKEYPQKKGELPNVPDTGITTSEGGTVHGGGPTATDGETEAVGGTPEGTGPESGAGTDGTETVRRPGTRPGRDTRTGGRGTDAITRGGIDNSGFYRITDDDNLGVGGAVTKFRNNVRAIRILKELMAENRLPTEDERKALVKYVGWGGLSERAFSKHERETGELAKELESLLTPEEFTAARASTKNAHYTSAAVVRFMWNLATRLGFNGNGTILETSMGTGNFLGLAPDGAVQKGNFIGAELDPLTGNIAKYLYPGAQIRIGGYETLMLPDNSVDISIGNVPFGDYKIFDPRYKGLNLLIHDYFFIKTLDKIRPSGMLLFITSKGTMDKGSERVRQLIADQADLVTAYRLPNTAFAKNANTEVTTDILVFQKRETTAVRGGESFLKTTEISPGLKINEYFANHPENMLGKMALTGTMYGGKEPTLEPIGDLDELMTKALESAPSNVMKGRQRASTGITPSIVDTVAPDTVKEGAYTLNDNGELVQRIDGVLTKPSNPAVYSKEKIPQMKALIDLREQAKKVIATQLTTSDDVPLKTEQEALGKIYDAYVKKYGILNGKASEIFSEDPQYPLLLALENYQSENKTAKKSDLFTKRTIRPITPLDAVSANTKEGLIQILSDRGFPDLPYLAHLSGKSELEVTKELESQNLIFKNPGSGTYEMAPVYLSGYVRDKLEIAKQSAKQNPEFQRNVEELEKVQPERISIKDVSVKFAAAWVPEEAYESFIKTVILNDPDNWQTKLVKRLPDGSWHVAFGSMKDVELRWGSDYLTPADLMNSGMNLRRPVIRWRDSDGKTHVDPIKTIAAREKLSKMKEAFQTWASSDPAWSSKLEDIWNNEANNIRLMEYDGSHLTLPGVSSEIGLRPHQMNGVWRIITDGRALLAHEVGTGKTFTMIAAGMELRRLGISKKNMYVIPNGKVEQFRDMFLALYPAANVLAIGRDDLVGDKRRHSVSRIATGDWDAVLLQHSSFGRIPMSPERMKKTIESELEELELALRAAHSQLGKGEAKRDPSVKALEKAKSRLHAHLKELQSLPKDDVINFDDLGVDYLFIDELHEFKNLAYYTKLSNVSGLGQKDAKKGTDLKAKTEYIQEKNRGRGVIGATGTPVSNTMAEVYNMGRYVAPDVWKNAGINFFDDWAANFGDVVDVMELSPDGRTYRARSKFSRFTNAPELMALFRSFSDVKFAADLNLPLPDLKGGRPTAIKVKSNEVIEPIFQSLLARAESLRANPAQSREKGGDNWLKLTGDGKKIALDARLYDATLPDHPDSKSNIAVGQIFDRWKSDKNTTQIVFADMYQDHDERFNLYKDMKDKLVKHGVPASEIAIAHSFKTDDQLERMKRQMNAGEIRILIGSTAKLGVGLNVQEKLKALHDLDAPWRPDQLEQRHGRIVRQGNSNKEVEILQYVTEKSFDAYIFQALETKARFIAQIMSGKTPNRNIDDAAGDVVLQYAELKAIASGNPDVKRKMELELVVGRLGSLEASHDSEERERKFNIRRKEQDAIDLNTQKQYLEKAKQQFEDYDKSHPPAAKDEEQTFDAIVGGTDFKSKQALIDYIKNNRDEVFRDGSTATLYGVPLKFETHGRDLTESERLLIVREGKEWIVRSEKTQEKWEDRETHEVKKFPSKEAAIDALLEGGFDIENQRKFSYRYLLANSWETVPPTIPGFLQSLKQELKKMGARITQRDEWAAEALRQAESIKKDIGKPFQYEEELFDARKELDEVDARLRPPEKPADDSLLDIDEEENGTVARPDQGAGNPITRHSVAGLEGDIPPPIHNPFKDRSSILPNRPPQLTRPPVTVGDKTYDPVIVKVSDPTGKLFTPTPGWEVSPGLAVTKALGDADTFVITHVPSGGAIQFGYKTPERAIAVAKSLISLGDWTRSQQEIMSDPDFQRAVANKLSSERGSIRLFSKPAPPPIPPADIPSPDHDMQQLVTLPRPQGNIWEEIKKIPGDVKRLMTSGRYNEDIKDFPVFAERVRRAQEIVFDASGKAHRQIYATLKGLHPTEYDVFRAIVFWEDMYETAARSGEDRIPLKGTNKLDRIEREVERLRGISTPAVLDAVDRHHKWMEEMWDDFVKRGKVDPNDGRVKYFPNMILHDVGDALDRIPGLPMRMQNPRRLYLKERKGHQTPHNADYIRVMEQYATRAYAHNMIDDFIDHAAAENDVLPTLSPAEQQKIFASTGGTIRPGSVYRNPADGSVLKGFQFNPGRVIYPVQAINEAVIRDAVNAGLDELGIDLDAYRQNLPSPELDTIMGERLTHTAYALGQQRKIHLLPIEIADKLEHFRDGNQVSAFTTLVRAATKAWKISAITFAGPSYHINNLIGDEITAYMEDIGSLAKQPEALKILKNKLTPPQYAQLVQLIEDARIWNSTFFSSGDVPRAIDAPPLRQYRQTTTLQKLNPFGSNPIGDVWREYQRWSNIRESVPRVAKFLADLERVRNGMPVVNSGVDLHGLDPRSLMAVGKVAREFNRDFGAVSPRMRLVYNTIFPFMSYHVGIVGPWLRRAAHKEKLFPGDEFLLKIVLPLIILPLVWNHFMYPDVEEQLPDWMKEMRHINTPFKDEKGRPQVITLETPVDIVMRWGGLHTAEANFDRYASGQWTAEQAARQQLEDIFGHQDKATFPTAPGAVMEQMLSPMIKIMTDLKANKDSFTGQQIVSTDSPNLWGDRSKAWPQTATGQSIYREYIVKKLISPYMQMLRASQSDNPDTPLMNWLTTTGPFGWKKALGIRSVNPDAGARSDWYAERNWNQALYDEKMTKVADAYVEYASGNITQDERDAQIAPLLDQAGPNPTFTGSDSDVAKLQQRPQFRIRVLEEMLRHETDPVTKLAMEDKIRSLRYQVDKDNYESSSKAVKPLIGLPPVPAP